MGTAHDIRVSTYPTVTGERIVLRLFRKAALPDLAGLGFPEAARQDLERFLQRPAGLLLLTGPAGSGKTTTTYACLQHLVRTGNRHIITIEDPVEQILPGVTQTEIQEALGLDLARAARHLLRQDPEVLVVGEIRDEETAQIVVRAALTGHLVLSTLHAGSCRGVLERLRLMCCDAYAAVSAVELILNQRLVRRLCAQCEGRGCDACMRTGYRGRIPVVEWYRVTESARARLRGETWASWRRIPRWQPQRMNWSHAAGPQVGKYNAWSGHAPGTVCIPEPAVGRHAASRTPLGDLAAAGRARPVKGPLARAEWERFEADLSRGLPLARALERRAFPELYKRLLVVGAQARDLPTVLNLLADYYLAQYQLWLRLKGLLVYPLVVLFGAFALSCVLHFHLLPHWQEVAGEALEAWQGNESAAGHRSLQWIVVGSWFAFLLLALLCAAVVLVFGSRRLRERLAWHLPAFRESWVAQTASSLALLLKGGVPLPEALPLVEGLFRDPVARADLARWRERLARGYAGFAEVAEGSQRFPPLFIWMVAGAGEDLAAGFEQAAAFYEERARARAEQLLAVTLPVLVIVTGGLVLLQASAVPMSLRAFFVEVQVVS